MGDFGYGEEQPYPDTTVEVTAQLDGAVVWIESFKVRYLETAKDSRGFLLAGAAKESEAAEFAERNYQRWLNYRA